MTFALATLAVASALLRFRDDPTVARAASVGATVGVALLCRHTGLVLAVAAVGVVAWLGRAGPVSTNPPGGPLRRGRAGGRYLLLWAGYRGFDPTPPTGPTAERFDAIVDDASASSTWPGWCWPFPRPSSGEPGSATSS